MFRYAVIILSIWGSVQLQFTWAQLPFVHSQSGLKPGDSIFYQIDELPRRINITAPGRDQVWNFGSLLSPYLEYQTIQIPTGDPTFLQVHSDRGVKQYVTLSTKSMIWNGSNRLMIGKTHVIQSWWSDTGLPLPSLDLAYQDDEDYSALYQCTMPASQAPVNWRNNLPSGIDSVRISALIDRSMSVDATGMLFLGGGYRQEVQRFRVEDLINKKLWVKKAQGTWQDVTSLVRLDDFLPEKTLSYHFISLENGGNICSVFLDPNGTPVKVTFLTPRELTRGLKTALASQYVYAYPNPALSIVRFKFLDIPPGDYSIKFYDVFMRSLFDKKYALTGEETVEINISQLEKGPYLYSLVDETGKKIVTKRLIVIKP